MQAVIPRKANIDYQWAHHYIEKQENYRWLSKNLCAALNHNKGSKVIKVKQLLTSVSESIRPEGVHPL